MKSRILLSLLCFVSMSASQVEVLQKPIIKILATNVLMMAPEAIASRKDISDVSVFHHHENFYTLHNGKITKIENYNVDKELRGISQENIRKALEQGAYFKLNRGSDGSYSLGFNARLLGGGPISAGIAYGVTKALCWGGLIGAATASIAIAAPAAAPALAMVSGGVSGSVAVTTAATGVSTIVAESAFLAAAATETAAVAGGVAGGVGLVAGIESASMGAFAFFFALPLP